MVEIKTVASHFSKYKGQIKIFIDVKVCWKFHNKYTLFVKIGLKTINK